MEKYIQVQEEDCISRYAISGESLDTIIPVIFKDREYTIISAFDFYNPPASEFSILLQVENGIEVEHYMTDFDDPQQEIRWRVVTKAAKNNSNILELDDIM